MAQLLFTLGYNCQADNNVELPSLSPAECICGISPLVSVKQTQQTHLMLLAHTHSPVSTPITPIL